MKKSIFLSIVAITGGLITANSQTSAKTPDVLIIQKHGVFSFGGRITEPVPGEYDATKNWLDLNNARIADLIAEWLKEHGL